jgi:hypothetical protein
MEFTLGLSIGILLAVIAIGVAGLAGAGVMAVQTVLMMVFPSMVVFAAIAFGIGVKHGAYRAGR